MTNKVIEYIEITQNTQILKIAVFAILDLRNHQKSPRPAKVDPRFDICRVVKELLQIKVTPPILLGSL